MGVVIVKELVLAEDIEFGFDPSIQDRGGLQLNAAYLPYTLTESVTDALNLRYTSVYIDTNFATINGNELNLFNVANGVSGFNAVNFAQLDLKADLTYTDAQLATKALLNGSPAEEFNVAPAVNDDEAMPKIQIDAELALKADVTVVDTKADKDNVLELNNTNVYSPLFDYNPATKKFVEDSVFTAFQSGVSGSFTSADGKTITVTNGLITGII